MRTMLWSAVAVLGLSWLGSDVLAEHSRHRGGPTPSGRSHSSQFYRPTYNYRDWSHHRHHQPESDWRVGRRPSYDPICPPIYVPPRPPRDGCHVPPPVCRPPYPPYPYSYDPYSRGGVTISGRNFRFGIDF